LKPKEVKENPEAIFVITQEPTLTENEYNGKKSIRVHCEGEWNKEKRTLDLAKTNSRTITKVLGSESKNWIGAQLLLEVYKMSTSEGKLTDAINVKEVKK
jgi:hypothetical protein